MRLLVAVFFFIGEGVLGLPAKAAVVSPSKGIIPNASSSTNPPVSFSSLLRSKYPHVPTPLITAILKEGVIQKVIPGKNSNQPFTILMQDVHGVQEAQANMGAVIKKILKTYPETVVGMEGTSGPVAIDDFRSLDARVNEESASFFLNTGFITGPEYAAIAADQTPTVVGLEEKEVYLANRSAVQEALAGRDQAAQKWFQELSRLDLQKETVYTPQMLTLDHLKKGLDTGETALGDYLSTLTKNDPTQNLKTLPQTSLFLKTWRLESSLNFDQIKSERADFIKSLSAQMSKPAMDQLSQVTAAHQSGSVTYCRFSSVLKKPFTRD